MDVDLAAGLEGVGFFFEALAVAFFGVAAAGYFLGAVLAEALVDLTAGFGACSSSPS